MKGGRSEEEEGKGRKRGEALKALESRGPLHPVSSFCHRGPILGEPLPGPAPSLGDRGLVPGAITHPPLGSRAVLQPNHRSRKEYHIPGFPKIKMENGALGKAAWIIKALIQTLVCPRATGS